MVKSITIGDKAYDMKTDLGVYELFKNEFCEELAPYLVSIQQAFKGMSETSEDEVKTYLIACDCASKLTKVAWTLIKNNNKDFIPYMEWIQELDNDVIGHWESEVLNLALQPFCGRKLPQDHKQPK